MAPFFIGFLSPIQIIISVLFYTMPPYLVIEKNSNLWYTIFPHNFDKK